LFVLAKLTRYWEGRLKVKKETEAGANACIRMAFQPGTFIQIKSLKSYCSLCRWILFRHEWFPTDEPLMTLSVFLLYVEHHHEVNIL